MPLPYFSALFPRLQNRIRQDIPTACPQNNDSLRRCLNTLFSRPMGEEGSLIGDPAFEATFGWRQGDREMKELAGNLLDERLCQCLSNPPKELYEDYAFLPTRKPYTHQLKAWEILCRDDPSSVVISSGTGSGKTECFMIPILDRLARQNAQTKASLEGIRALFLYPLNALISSQRDRLDAWTRGFNGDIRFCLYNGNTPESLPHHEKNYCNEVRTREELRASPPPILFTNATMLEYMLVRTEDAPILNKSQGTLEWIVLDEAHCYIGSQAAELALLLRRVQMAFGVQPDTVRFIATSATIGDPEGSAGQDLKCFLADVAGIPVSQVSLITGQRLIPELPPMKETPASINELEELEALSPEDAQSASRYEALCRSGTAKAIRSLFTRDKTVARLAEIRSVLKVRKHSNDISCALRWLDVLSWTKGSDGTPFLPLRAHIFSRGLSGIWACADPKCPHKQEELHNDWPYGAVWTESRKHCTCGSPVYEVVTCSGCRTPYLLAEKQDMTDSRGQPVEYLVHKEHSLDLEEEEDTLLDEEASLSCISDSYAVLLIRSDSPTKALFLDKTDCKILDQNNGNAIRIFLEEPNHATGSLACPHCQEKPKSIREFYYYNIISTTYLQNAVTSVFLEFAPDGKDPAQHPCRGRKILTFNDSRQGTARTAMRMQRFSELARIRGLLYHIGLRDCQSGSDDECAKQEHKIATLEALPPDVRSGLQSIIDEEKRTLQRLKEIRPIPFDTLAKKIQNERSSFEQMYQIYREKAPRLLSSDSGMTDFARMLLFREFGRRPARAVNLETLGLMAVRYQALEQVTKVPSELASMKLTLEDWKDFLKICLDFMFRANGATEFPNDWRKWLGMTYNQNFILPPDTETHERNLFQLIWPQCHRSKQHRLVRLLERALNLDASQRAHADIIDSILRQAWNQLTNDKNPCKPHEGGGFLLRDSAMSFAPLEKAWFCPFTRRFLDTTFVKISPYLPRKSVRSDLCHEYEIPLYPHPFGTSSRHGVQEARAWLAENDKVDTLRRAGFWSAAHDSVVELPPYFTAQEHSAQLSSSDLARCTQKFREGDINVLSCSTTMEMGIDIGGISIVGMNNAPPHPANYLQRAGRSGRRGETRALTFTMCKNNPHEMAAFSHSRWAFDTAIPVPRVSLNSPVILQRHINAFLLTNFLKKRHQQDDTDLAKLSCVSFFTGTQPAARLFSQSFSTLEEDSPLADGIRLLCRNSIFQNERPEDMAQRAAAAMDKAFARWTNDYNVLCETEKTILSDRNQANSAPRKAVSSRKNRMAGEYLLTELITQEFLPAHGFPQHVATFDFMHDTLFKGNQGEDKNGKGKASGRRELPSRSLSTALTEYAPGNSVAINGLIYESKGITLNWHIPASQQAAAELQNIRSRWRCRHCGSFGTTASREARTECSNCGRPLSGENWREYLEPAGFAVDFSKEPSNNSELGVIKLSQATANVCVYGSWTSLGLSEMARFRCDTSGTVFHVSRGLFGKGYAVCLACGRVESIPASGELPSAILKHTKLRGDRHPGYAGKYLCPACEESMEWKIKAPLWLAYESKTDVLELQIRKEDMTWLNDETQAFPIAVALRDALAARLGIQTEELECSVESRRMEEENLCTSIFIFDKNAAGYASSAAEYIEDLLHDARRRLLCLNHNCETACPHCILSFDLRYQSKELDRHKGLEILTETWLSLLNLPQEAHVFGPSTQVETIRLEESVLSYNLQHPHAKVFLHLGEHSHWQPGDKEMLHLLDHLRARGAQIVLSLEHELYNGFSPEERMLLVPLVYGNVSCSTLKGGFCDPHTRLAVTIEEGETLYRWALYQKDEHFLLLKGKTRDDFGIHHPVLLNELYPKQGNSTILQIKQNENTSVINFGSWLWTQLQKHLENDLGIHKISIQHQIKNITFSDRYCNSPLTIGLLHSMLRFLQSIYGDAWGTPSLSIMLSNHITGEYAHVWDNWSHADIRDSVAKLLLKDLGTIHIVPMEKNAMAHARSLNLEFIDGSILRIWFDQGLGFLRVAHSSPDRLFPFRKTHEEQVFALQKMDQTLEVVPGGTVISMQLLSA